jgi:acyl transferase domain-containing protein
VLFPGYVAAVVARALGLGGVSLSLDAACATSLYAVKLACHYLHSGQADMMLAGAVSCPDPMFMHMGFSIFQAYPQQDQGTSRPLDRSSQGLFSGEGAGIVVLKRTEDALRDGDTIYATIRGGGLSNDGSGKHLLIPNPKGQLLAFERAYAEAGVDPHTIDYVECHATGTPVGDITELNSMAAFFGTHGTAPRIGSVKSNVGHLLTAAGMASLIKVVLSMQQNQVPPTINLENPLASHDNTLTAQHAVSELIAWPAQSDTRRAGVSAFGFGGVNAHLVLEHGPGQGSGVGGRGSGVGDLRANAPLFQPSNVPTFQRFNAPTLQRSNAPTLQRSNAPTLQRSNVPTLLPLHHRHFLRRQPIQQIHHLVYQRVGAGELCFDGTQLREAGLIIGA